MDDYRPNFIIVPQQNPTAILWEAFPELRSELEDPSEGSYYNYARFVDYLLQHHGSEELWQRVYALCDSLATGANDLQDLLVIEIFEGLYINDALMDRLKRNLGPGALKLLEGLKF